VPSVRTPTLEIGYEEWGDPAGAPVGLLHGFPDDALAWEEVAPALAARGYRVLAPYLRGYGPTRFLDPAEPRMAQQAAIGQDLLDFIPRSGSSGPPSPATTGGAARPASRPSWPRPGCAPW
jgi:pimeloyl-ACP methyl ester carboxylesterase